MPTKYKIKLDRNATAFPNFLQRNHKKGIDERNKVKRSQFLPKRSRELAHGLGREQNKKNATAFPNFLQRNHKKGIDERNKVKRSQFLPKRSRELAHGLGREQNKKNATAFLFLAKEPQKRVRRAKQSEAKSIPHSKRAFLQGINQKKQQKPLRLVINFTIIAPTGLTIRYNKLWTTFTFF